jgi:glutamate racemase
MTIGLFDSGLGGLTILRAVARTLPQYDYVYYGDTANLPYGDKTEAEIYDLSVAAMDYLFGEGCALIIIACNTASAETLRKLQDDYLPTHYPNRRILGVIIPTVETLIAGGVEAALLLATKRTVESKKYERELQKRQSTLSLSSTATPELVPLIEAGKSEEAVAAAIARIDAQVAVEPSITAVVLGCTHYTELAHGLRAHYGERLHFYSQDEIIPQKLAAYVAAHPELASVVDGGEAVVVPGGRRSIHLTAHRPDYDRVIAQLLGGVFVSEE